MRTFLYRSQTGLAGKCNPTVYGKGTRAPLGYSYRRFASTSRTTGSGSTTKSLPLAGLQILDFSRVLAGPYCTQILADYGASVIKVEQPGVGDETRQWRAAGESQVWKDGPAKMSLYFSAVNRNKRSITLNLKSTQGVEIAKRLAAESNVVIHNFLPGGAEAMGLGYDDLRHLNKQLIYASISGYGTSGPNRARPGYDAIALGESGILHITGEAGGPPAKPGVAMLDMCTGLYVHGAILAALSRRDRTGHGSNIEGSLFETGLSLLINVGLTALNLDVNGDPDARRRGERWGLEHPSLAPYGAFATKDGKYIFIAANNNRQWNILCDTIHLTDIVNDPRYQTNDDRLCHREELNRSIGDKIVQRTKDKWMELLHGSGLSYGAINDVVEALEHPQAAAREMVMDVRGIDAAKEGQLKLIAPAVKFSNTSLGIRINPPKLGEHTDQVLRELGYCDGDIANMRESGAI